VLFFLFSLCVNAFAYSTSVPKIVSTLFDFNSFLKCNEEVSNLYLYKTELCFNYKNNYTLEIYTIIIYVCCRIVFARNQNDTVPNKYIYSHRFQVFSTFFWVHRLFLVVDLVGGSSLRCEFNVLLRHNINYQT